MWIIQKVRIIHQAQNLQKIALKNELLFIDVWRGEAITYVEEEVSTGRSSWLTAKSFRRQYDLGEITTKTESQIW